MYSMSKFEKKFGKYAIPNLSTVLIICYAAGYLIQMVNADFINYLTLNTYAILHGQIWRLVTWVIVPPPSSNLFFILLMLYFYWSIGSTLERTWGTYRYNVYIFSGMLFTLLGSFLLLAYYYISPTGDVLRAADPEWLSAFFASVALLFSTYYINMSIFLAFAATFPDAQVLLMFLVPVKVKWMGIVYGGVLIWDFISSGSVPLRFVMGFSLMNFLVFFLTSRRWISNPKQMYKRQEFKREVHKRPMVAIHKCAICGRTSETNPELEFRFCSKCVGNYEYCQEHLFTHKHEGRES